MKDLLLLVFEWLFGSSLKKKRDERNGHLDNKHGTELTKEQREAYLIEYQMSQQSAEHHDTLLWTSTGIIWAANFVLFGLISDNIFKEASLQHKCLLTLISSVAIIINAAMLALAYSFRRIRLLKYKRCQRIEKRFGLWQHRWTKNKSRQKKDKPISPRWWYKIKKGCGFQTCIYWSISIIFILVLIIILIVTWAYPMASHDAQQEKIKITNAIFK